jgi:hypothetical protein
MADLWQTAARPGVRAGDLDDRGWSVGAARDVEAGQRRRAVRFVASAARDAGDAAMLLAMLGLEAVEGRGSEETAA